ncbi:hypothetical protein WJX74_009984 [Apatococcus lobatus]|uniref:DUF1990 domain-containing protein n=1 Tax=Apatococcus lobatus TaxID=904363 RepID=A0AAW1S3W6_9CHLO
MIWGFRGLGLGRPSFENLQQAAAEAEGRPVNHPYEGLSREAPPFADDLRKRGWQLDIRRGQVGHGKQVYGALSRALKTWSHMDLGWCDTNRPMLESGNPVCIAAKTLFLWTRNPLRIVYAAEEQYPKPFKGRRLLYGQSTLLGHQLAGEERFGLEWHAADDSVWYEICTFSRPASALAALTYPLVRKQQHRFQQQSFKKMRTLAIAAK